MTHNKTSMPNRYRRAMTPTRARALSVVSLISLWGWFLLKILLRDDAQGFAIAVGSLALLGFGGSCALFATQYLDQAYASDHEIDERELALRNRAHRYALNYVLWILALASIALEVVGRAPAPTASGLALNFPITVSAAALENFLFVLFFTTFSMPPTILAWWDRGETGEG